MNRFVTLFHVSNPCVIIYINLSIFHHLLLISEWHGLRKYMTAIIILMVWVIYVRNMNKHIVLFDNKNTEVILVRKLLLHSRLWSKAIILLADMSHGLRKYVYGTLLCARVKLVYIEISCMCGDVLHRQRAHFAMRGWVFYAALFSAHTMSRVRNTT